jgi:glycosyltransferase 2 family protein
MPGPLVRSCGWVWSAAASAGILAGASAIAARGVPSWEAEIFHALHEVPRTVDYILWLPMQLGSAWAPPIVALIGWQVSRSWRPTAGALVAGWGGWWLAKAMKAGIERGRPAAELGDRAGRSTAVTEGLGFVSGHATVAFACAAVISPYLSRGWMGVAWALATTVALSRVVVGAHLPLDVVGGAALGVLLASLWHLAVGAPRRSNQA